MLNAVLELKDLKNDAALARALKIPPYVISKVRSNTLPVGPALLVRLHEFTGLPTRELKEMAGMPPC